MKPIGYGVAVDAGLLGSGRGGEADGNQCQHLILGCGKRGNYGHRSSFDFRRAWWQGKMGRAGRGGGGDLYFGVALLMVLLWGSDETKATLLQALPMLIISAVQRFALTSQIVVLGRIIDWIALEQPSPERSSFWMLHNAFAGLELLNLALGLFLAAKLIIRRQRRSADPGTEAPEGRGRVAG